VDFLLGLLGIWLWLVLASSEKEGSDHVPHEVLRSQLNDVEILIAEVLSVCKQGCEHSIGALRGETEYEGPVEEPRGLLEHAHWTFIEAVFDHVLDLANGSELGALTRLAKLNLTGKQSPEDLRDELVVSRLLVLKNFLKREQVRLSLLVLLLLEEDLRILEEVVAVLDCYLLFSAEVGEVELLLVSHLLCRSLIA